MLRSEGEQSILLYEADSLGCGHARTFAGNLSCADYCFPLGKISHWVSRRQCFPVHIEIGSPKELNAARISFLNETTRDLQKKDKIWRCGPIDTAELTLPMHSNDVMLVKMNHGQREK